MNLSFNFFLPHLVNIKLMCVLIDLNDSKKAKRKDKKTKKPALRPISVGHYDTCLTS